MKTQSLPPYAPSMLGDYEQAIGLKRLSPWWAKAELFLGLLAMGIALVLIRDRTNDVVAVALFVLGGYLCLAGNRSHLYQSMNRQTAYLAGLMLRRQPVSDEKQ